MRLFFTEKDLDGHITMIAPDYYQLDEKPLLDALNAKVAPLLEKLESAEAVLNELFLALGSRGPAIDAVRELREENEQLKEALKFYADPGNYVVRIEYDERMKPISSFNPMSEGGEKARAALGDK